MVYGLGFRVNAYRLRVKPLESRLYESQRLRSRVKGLGFGFRVKGLGFRV